MEVDFQLETELCILAPYICVKSCKDHHMLSLLACVYCRRVTQHPALSILLLPSCADCSRYERRGPGKVKWEVREARVRCTKYLARRLSLATVWERHCGDDGKRGWR